MSVKGNLEDFSVVDIIQYIHASKKSGTVYIQRGEQFAHLYFIQGQIVRASVPGCKNIGDILLDKGMISPVDLKNALHLQESWKEPKPLGAVLKETRVINHDQLREAVLYQIEEGISKLVHWSRGAFRFELEELKSPDDISVAPLDLLLPEEADTQFLLLEAVRKFDESNKDEEFLDSEIHEVMTPTRDQLHYLKKMLQSAVKEEKGLAVTIHFLNLLSEYLERSILFLYRPGVLVGMEGYGALKEKGSLKEEAKNLRIPLNQNSLVTQYLNSRSLYHGQTSSDQWFQTLYDRIGPPTLDEVVLLPVVGVQQMICLVYGDNGFSKKSLTNVDLLEVAAGQVGLIIEINFLLKCLNKNQSEVFYGSTKKNINR